MRIFEKVINPSIPRPLYDISIINFMKNQKIKLISCEVLMMIYHIIENKLIQNLPLFYQSF